MAMVFKICAEAEWHAAIARNSYEGSDDDRRDGFIHLSAEPQLRGTLARHFAGQAGLVLIAFDESSLAGLKWEESRGGALFPHVYGTLEPARALWVKTLSLQDGQHLLPEGIGG